MLTKGLPFFALLIVLLYTQCQPANGSNYYLTVKGKTIKVEIAADEESRDRGLMFRDSLPPDSGMLFIFPEEDIRDFWMKNTQLPLSIAYITANGLILNIKDMQPLSLDSVNSEAPAQYALEMNQGWFNKNNIKAGDTIIFSPEIRRKYQ